MNGSIGATMNKAKTRQFLQHLLILGALAVAISARGDEIDRDWKCENCPSAEGWELDIKGGPAYVDDDDFRFGDYTGLDSKGSSRMRR